MDGPRPRIESRLEPLHDIVEILGPAWERETDPDARAALAQALEVTAQAAARTAQARRDRRGPGVRPAPARRPGGQSERPVDRDPLAAPPGRRGSIRRPTAAPTDHRDSDGRRGRSPSSTRRPDNDRDRSVSTASPGLADLALGLAGCGPGGQARASPRAVAPVRPVAVKAERLPDVKFVDVTEESGIHFVHYNGAFGEKLLPETMGSGVAFLDYDRDGDQDLFFVNPSDWPDHEVKPAPTQALYRNDGKGHFEDVTKEAGLDKTFYGMGVAVGDYDNDGDPDLYVTAIGGGHLFRNDGKGQFDDVTDAGQRQGRRRLAHRRRRSSTSRTTATSTCSSPVTSTWTPEIDKVQGFQLTGPGRAYGPPTSFSGSFCMLLRNDGGKFTDISESAGIQVRTPDLKVPVAKSLGVAPYDVDGDGLVDIAVANDTVQNFLFHNKGAASSRRSAMSSGVAFDQSGSPRGGMGIDWADFKNDDRSGLAIGNFANEMTALYVCDEPRRLQFSDLANLYGLGAPTQPPLKFGLFFFDYDLDGRLDLLSANGHLETDISKVQASETYEQPAQLFWNSGKPGRDAVRAGQARERRPRPLQADRRSRQRLRRHRRRRRPGRRRHRQQRLRRGSSATTAATRTTGSGSS